MPRIYTPLDLRNIKDIYTRVAFRRLDQWLRDIAGSLSSTQAGSTANQVQIIQQIINAPPSNRLVLVDDMQASAFAAGVPSLTPRTPLNFNWSATLSTGPNGFSFDTSTFPSAYGVWKAAPGGNMGEFVAGYTAAALTGTEVFGDRPREPFEYHVGAAISTSPQRNHTRFGIGVYPGGSEFPLYYIGFVYWYVDQDYTAQQTYTTFSLLNDPGSAAGRQDMLLAEVVDNGHATAQFLTTATSHTGKMDDLSFILNKGSAAFSINGVSIGVPMTQIAKGSQVGNFVWVTRAHGSGNPGTAIQSWQDYVKVVIG